MNENVKEYIDKYSNDIKELYIKLRAIIYDSVTLEIEEKLWAKLPSYYVGNNFIRLIPFKDHINVEALSVIKHKEELSDYKITSKGMLQIYLNENIPSYILEQIFKETLFR